MKRFLLLSLFSFLAVSICTSQESTSKIHMNLGSLMNEGMIVGIGKKTNENRVWGLTIAEFSLSQSELYNTGGNISGNNNSSFTNEDVTNKLSLGVFTKKYKNNFFTFSSLHGSYRTLPSSQETLPNYVINYSYSAVNSTNDAIEFVMDSQEFTRQIDYDRSKSYEYNISINQGFGYSYKLSEKFRLEGGLFAIFSYNYMKTTIDRGVIINGFFDGYWEYDPNATVISGGNVIYNSRLVSGYEVDLYENDFEEETTNGFDLKICLSVGLAIDLN